MLYDGEPLHPSDDVTQGVERARCAWYLDEHGEGEGLLGLLGWEGAGFPERSVLAPGAGTTTQEMEETWPINSSDLETV